MPVIHVTDDLPPEGRSALVKALREGVAGSSFQNSLNVLLAKPDLAKDGEIHQLVVKTLMTEFYGNRVLAARVLYAIGDPAGIVHLTYNSLGEHPLLHVKQCVSSAWADWVARCAFDLTDECIDWLVSDILGEHALFHGVTLAQLPAATIGPRVVPLLELGGWAARNAAYVLACNGIESGYDVLEQWLKAETYPLVPALEALVHLGTERAKNLLSEYADPGHPLYAQDKTAGSHYRTCALPFARLGTELCSSSDPLRVSRILERFYSRTFHELDVFGRDSPDRREKRRLAEPVDLFVNNNTVDHLNLWATSFMARFSTSEDRKHCAHRQGENIRRLFETNSLDFRDLDDGATCPFIPPNILMPTNFRANYGQGNFYTPLSDLRIRYDRADYVYAATSWLIDPWRWQQTW